MQAANFGGEETLVDPAYGNEIGAHLFLGYHALLVAVYDEVPAWIAIAFTCITVPVGACHASHHARQATEKHFGVQPLRRFAVGIPGNLQHVHVERYVVVQAT